ncbi:LOW QUALITY PROTEIN: cell cycle and apoptosis regulator protein 2 [Morus bassanus]
MVAELFQEMLQQDFGYNHYKALLALLKKEELPETRNLEPERAAKMVEEEAEQICTSVFQQPKALDPSAVLSLDALLAFVYFDWNFCGYLHRREEELFGRCRVRWSLCCRRSCGGRVVLVPGNLPLLPPAPAQVSQNVRVLNLGKLLEKAEHQLYLESKIHVLEVKLGKSGRDVLGRRVPSL